MQLDKIFLKLGLTSSSAELITLALVLIVISAIFWLLIGRFRLHNFLINIYISFALLAVLPQDMLTFTKSAPALVFLIFIVLLTLMNRYLFDIHQSGSGLAIWQVFVVSFLEVGLMISIILSYIPSKEVLKYLSRDASFYFVSPWAKFVWMVLPIAFLIFVKKREK